MIRIEATDIHDAKNKLGLGSPASDITIIWRKDRFDYKTLHKPGCIVDARSVSGEEVQRRFPRSSDAIRYITGLLKLHDKYSLESKRNHDKEMRKQLKAKK